MATFTTKAASTLFRGYPLLKVSLDAYEAEKRGILEACPGSPAVVGGKKRGAHGDPTPKKVEALEALEGRYRSALRSVKAVEDALACLDAETRKIAKSHFFKGFSAREIAAKLHFGQSTVERRISKALDVLAFRMAWEPGLCPEEPAAVRK